MTTEENGNGARGRTVAVIDVGSSSVRLLVARELSPAAFEVVDEERFDARIGEGQQRTGELSTDGIARGVRAMEVMTALAGSYQSDATAIVGTEALRRAANAGEFLQAVRETCGAQIRVLSGEEEAGAAFLGVANSTLLTDGFVLDIGGGSLEVMAVAGRQLQRVQSAPLGAIYAREKYFASDPPSAREVRGLRKAVRSTLEVGGPKGELYGTGGAVRGLGRLIRARRGYPLRRLHGLVLTRREVHRISNALAAASPEERRRMPGLGANRVDTLPVAALVIDEVMDCLEADTLTVAGQGLREGVVWQLLRGGMGPIEDVRGASIEGLARANGVGEPGATSVAETAALLFDAAGGSHGLGRWERELLGFAAQLAGIGMHVDYYNRDRHAEYLVHSGDLRGFSHREIVLLAALVRWAGDGTPDISAHRRLLETDDQRRASVLAAILGVARAIHRRGVATVAVRDLKTGHGRLKLRLHGSDSLAPELLEIERQAKRFESVLKLELVAERTG